jgi:hypothetical protein
MSLLVYPSAGDSRVVINGRALRSIFRIEIQHTKNVTPIIGYNRKTATALVPGSEIVEGSIAINFYSRNYLADLIRPTFSFKPDFADWAMREVETYDPDAPARIQEQTRLKHAAAPINPLDLDPFDLKVYYFDVGKTVRTIVGCRLISEGQVLSAAPHPEGDASSSGSPIIEQYSFVAISTSSGTWKQSTLPELYQEDRSI